MNIKLNKNIIVVEHAKGTVNIIKEDGLTVYTPNGSVNKPGEYEFDSVNIHALEIPVEDKFSSKISVAKVTVEDVSIAFFLDSVKIPENVFEDIYTADIVMICNVAAMDIKEIVHGLTPKLITLVESEDLGDAAYAQSVSGELGINAESDTKLKAVKSDFSTDEDQPIKYFVLKSK